MEKVRQQTIEHLEKKQDRRPFQIQHQPIIPQESQTTTTYSQEPLPQRPRREDSRRGNQL